MSSASLLFVHKFAQEGEDAPKRSELGDWLLDHPGWKPLVNIAGALPEPCTEVTSVTPCSAFPLVELAEQSETGSSRMGRAISSDDVLHHTDERRMMATAEALDENPAIQPSIEPAALDRRHARSSAEGRRLSESSEVDRVVRSEVMKLEQRLVEAQSEHIRAAVASMEKRIEARCAVDVS